MAALRAGAKLAASAQRLIIAVTDIRVGASHALTPNSKPRINLAAPIEQRTPRTRPTVINRPASVNIKR